MEEVWKQIEGYENYMVSNLGRVKSLSYNTTGEERIMKPFESKKGYLHVDIFSEGKRKSFSVHRLVAIAFIPNPDNKDQVDHIDTDRKNNIVTNLRWCTGKENCNNEESIKHYSECRRGEKNPFYGRHFTDDMKKRMSEIKKDPNHNFKGQHLSEEWKRNIGLGNSKKIIQYTIEGEFVKEWIGMSEASRQTGIHLSTISQVCRGLKNQAGGYKWRYA